MDNSVIVSLRDIVVEFDGQRLFSIRKPRYPYSTSICNPY